jgi:hypothetical protein
MFRDLEGLVSITEATPEPRAGEVVVRVGATSLNYRDHAILMGWSPFPTKAGLVPVSDAAGVVEAVGEGVARFSVGDWVLSSFYPTWFGGARTPMFDFYGTECHAGAAECWPNGIAIGRGGAREPVFSHCAGPRPASSGRPGVLDRSKTSASQRERLSFRDRPMGGRLYRAHTTMIEGWERQDAGPDRLWRVAIRERCAVFRTVRAPEPCRSPLRKGRCGTVAGFTHDGPGGFTLPVHQHWWGHKARKATRLYVVGCKPQDVPLIPTLAEPTRVIPRCPRLSARRDIVKSCGSEEHG